MSERLLERPRRFSLRVSGENWTPCGCWARPPEVSRLATRTLTSTCSLVLVQDASWEGKRRVYAAFDEAARALDLECLTPCFSVDIQTPDWLEGRSAIRSVVLHRRSRWRQDRRRRLGMNPRQPSLSFWRRLSVAAARSRRDRRQVAGGAISFAYYDALRGAGRAQRARPVLEDACGNLV